MTNTLITLSNQPEQLTEEDLNVIERFIVISYQRTCTAMSCDRARRLIFTSGRGIEKIPPRTNALSHHTMRAIYQGGFVWSQMFEACPVIPNPSDRGWVKNTKWEPVWSSLPQAALACRELIRCGCKVSCSASGRCKCTELCFCKGGCVNNE